MWTDAEQRGSSTVARRLVLLFVFAALIPIVTLSILAFDQVSATLHEQGQKRVRSACKSAGMSVLGGLQDVELTLSLLSELQIEASWEQPGANRDALLGSVREHFTSLAVSDLQGHTRSILGLAGRLPMPPPEVLARLAQGKRALMTRTRTNGSVAILMLAPLGPAALGDSWLIGEVDAERLKLGVVDGALPPLGEFCVFDDRGAVIVCSGEGIEIEAISEVLEPGSPDMLAVEWRGKDETYLTARWTVFLESLYGVESWHIVFGEPRSETLGALARFRAFFPLVVLVFLGVACLLCISQLRRSLAPLTQLQRGTQDIASGAFDTRVDVRSGDEFELLADSFNGMAARLQEQFGFLETMVEIDRAVLSKTEAEKIACAILERIRDLVDCSLAAVVLVDSKLDGRSEIHLSRQSRGSIEVTECDAHCTRALSRLLATSRDAVEIDLCRVDSGHPLRFLVEEGMRSCILISLAADSVVFGGLVLAFDGPDAGEMGGYVHVEQVLGQASVALQNARILEQNKVLAYYDNLTELPNRLMFMDRLEQALLDAERHGGRLAICLLDLDGFKQINDNFGHDAGDQTLKEQGRRIADCVRAGGVARLGGDEFTILIRDFERSEVPALVMTKVLADLMRPMVIRGHEVVITASVGIAVYPDDGQTGDVLLRHADSAMYHAKKRGRNNYQFYTEAMNTAALDRLEMEGQLRGALARGELFVEFQPVFEVDSRQITGCEALLRWRSPTRGMVSPTRFIAILEQTGLIVEIGEWVLRKACSEMAAMARSDIEPLHVAVNVSARQFSQPDFPAVVEMILEETGFPPQQLILEMTESMLIDSAEDTLRRLAELRRVGVRLSIDDFGTGYSSLSYLKYFPIDFLKIDRSFITDLARSGDDAAITRAIIAMAHSLSLQVIAEGVETEAQLAFLQRENCEFAQGFLVSQSVAADGFEKLLREQS